MEVVLIIVFALALAGYAAYLFSPTVRSWFGRGTDKKKDGDGDGTDSNTHDEEDMDGEEAPAEDDSDTETEEEQGEEYVDPYGDLDTQIIGSSLK